MTTIVTSSAQPLTRSEKFFVFFAIATGFLIGAEYATTRPASSSIFLSIFSAQTIPWIWLCSLPFNFFVVYLYNRFLPKIGPLRMFKAVVLIVCAVHLTCALALHIFPYFIFVQFVWKDVYILLMFKQLWSMIHGTIAARRAKYLYGIIFGMGTVGSICGSFISGFCATKVGSENLFFCTLIFYFLLYCSYSQAFKRSALQNSAFFKQSLTDDPSAREGIALIKRSSFLKVILLLVVFMQVSIGLMDYQFNAFLEMHVVVKNLRTEYVGRVVGLTNLLSGIFQFIGGFFMIHILGVRGSHLFIPLLLFVNASVCCIVPSFAVMSCSYALLKSVDFSLFAVAREMLYVNLKLDEKFRAKAIIDIFAYRSAKALVSIFILSLQFLAPIQVLYVAKLLSVLLLFCWILFIFFAFREFKPSTA